jgi:hypothetical protein
MRDAKRNPLSDLTNSNHFSSSSVSSSATIHPIKNNPINTSNIRRNHSLSQTSFNPVDVKPSPAVRSGKVKYNRLIHRSTFPQFLVTVRLKKFA